MTLDVLFQLQPSEGNLAHNMSLRRPYACTRNLLVVRNIADMDDGTSHVRSDISAVVCSS